MGDDFCSKCGEILKPTDNVENTFLISYRYGRNNWSTVRLCCECQMDLRNEFHRKGLINH